MFKDLSHEIQAIVELILFADKLLTYRLFGKMYYSEDVPQKQLWSIASNHWCVKLGPQATAFGLGA